MKIQDPNLAGSSAATGHAPPASAIRNEESSRADGAQRPAAADRVEMSSLTGRLAAALAAGAQERAGRVQSLARAFQSGNYQADAQSTSRALVTETLAAGTTGKAGEE
jgi:anti-sigma28 factor (negative regulator of flagellin synthesis)